MRLMTFSMNGLEKLGVVTANGIIDAAANSPHPAFASMQALIDGGEDALRALRCVVAGNAPVLAPPNVQWLAPLPHPTQMRDFIAFEEHMRQAGWNGAKIRASWGGSAAPPEPPPIPPIWYRQPIYYKCNRFAVAGTGAVVQWPDYSHIIDYELEIACVIGAGGKNVAVEQATHHIFGYTIFNDLTARDAQFQEMQGPLGPAKGKDFDGANILGPVIVTADSFDPARSRMSARVNGQVWSDGLAATMHWSFAQIIAHVSRCETLYPGEVLGSGTVGGGCGLELGRFLKHGDLIELEVDGIGRLSNRIDAPHVPLAYILAS